MVAVDDKECNEESRVTDDISDGNCRLNSNRNVDIPLHRSVTTCNGTPNVRPLVGNNDDAADDG